MQVINLTGMCTTRDNYAYTLYIQTYMYAYTLKKYLCNNSASNKHQSKHRIPFWVVKNARKTYLIAYFENTNPVLHFQYHNYDEQIKTPWKVR